MLNKKHLTKTFSPDKLKKCAKKQLLINGTKPSTSGSTALTIQTQSGSQTSIKVIVRVRPQNELELQDNCRTIIKVVDDKMLIFDPKEDENPFFYRGIVQRGRDLLRKQNKELQFIFDKIFDMQSTNNDVFEGSTKDLIASLLDGYNCSVFAYGATGAGKTHTMLGCNKDPGITYRTVAELFSQIESQGEHREFNLGVTYLEVYNENVQDLLHKSGPLHLRDDGRYGIIVAGLKVITIQNAEELLSLLAKGNRNRTQHPTDANEESSRSHAVFQVYINITNKLDGQVRQVKLSMIDLAGSERASATGSKGARFKEGTNINKSLLALGNCINSLADGAKHITYRDSKLTRLLKDSLGGNCQTVMIANIAPSSFSYEDTYNTLRYANRAKKIKTHIKKNIISCEMHVTAYIKMVEEQKKEINYLKQKLLALENGSVDVLQPPDVLRPSENAKVNEEIESKLTQLFQKKKVLNEKILSLESADKILCCRIQYKKAADERLHNLTATVDATSSEEHNASGKLRVNKSLQYFERQRDSLKTQMIVTWEELCSCETELQKLKTEITSQKLEKLEDIISQRTCEVEKARLQQQYEHVKKICNLQQCEMLSNYSIIKTMSITLQNYYNTMRNNGAMTDTMKDEFRQLIKLLEGVRNIKWSDVETIDHEEHFYSLTCLLSTSNLMDPLHSKVPVFTTCALNNQNQDNCSKDALNTTFNASSSNTDSASDLHNVTVTLLDGSNSTVKKDITESDENAAEERSIDICTQGNTRKRVLVDKNRGDSGKTPTKQQKKIFTKYKDSLDLSGFKGKENKHVQKSHTMMSAKSIATLNKLKADKFKKDSFDMNTTPAALKVVREKERRGLMTTHPYQKPNGKQKSASGMPSSRGPWL
ncbi:kinesin-like protein KIF18A [Nomia melanderi]|uniref:kinesin-like protein KIF18A n=1 Tax=Nomia melanderi TaxID=2448451 RepID=UPI0013042BC1|nr:kinesin-like protein KIF18A [Nomia melanderi]